MLTAALVIRGMGLGLVMSPLTAAAYVLLPRDALARASSLATAIRRIGGSVGTALLAVILVQNASHTPAGAGTRGLSLSKAVSPGSHAALLLAHAFRHTFWIALAITAVVVPPAFFLPSAADARKELCRLSYLVRVRLGVHEAHDQVVDIVPVDIALPVNGAKVRSA